MKAASTAPTPVLPGMRTPKEIFRELRNYLAGQFVGATRDEALLDELLKCLFCKLYVETGKAGPPPAGIDALALAKWVRALFGKVREDFADVYDQGVEILLSPEAIFTVFKACDFSLIDSHSDPIGDAFEVFAGSESRGKSGQFFTPRSVTDFLVQAMNPKAGELVIDPACGAGGFLTSTTRHFLDAGVTPAKVASLAERTIFGIDKDSYLTKLARIHLSLLTGGHPNIEFGDSIAMQTLEGESLWERLPEGGVDVVLTNPPFGSRIVAASPDVMRTLEIARKWRLDPEDQILKPTRELQNRVPPQVLFVERCLSLLKPGGRLGMVLPESVLSNKSYRYLVQYLRNEADIQGVIGMPEALFKTSGKGGTHTKTCLLLARRLGGRTRRTKRVFMAEAKWCGQDSRARTIEKNDLPEIASNWSSHVRRNGLVQSPLGFTVGDADIRNNVLRPRYYDPQIDSDLAKLKRSHNLYRFGDLIEDGTVTWKTGHEVGKLAYGTGDIPFIRTSDISNWELKADPKHGLSEDYYSKLSSKQDVQPLDILMVKDGTYLIGTCAIVTEHDSRIVYQSHLYKIRVLKDKHGLNPFLLLAALSCDVVRRQIRAKQFTQDIIDSLGQRIAELVLPIPKAAARRETITKMVRESIYARVKARNIAEQARGMIDSVR